MAHVLLIWPDVFCEANTPVPVGAAPSAQDIPEGSFPVIDTRSNLAEPVAGNDWIRIPPQVKSELGPLFEMVVFSISKAVALRRIPPAPQLVTVTWSRARMPPEAFIPIDDKDENVTA